MVATRGTQDVVGFVTGMAEIDPQTIRLDEWVKILRAAIDLVPINYLRGFELVPKTLQYEGFVDIQRHVDISFPAVSFHSKTMERRWEMRPNAVFLNCAEYGEEFPVGSTIHERWSTAPRTENGDLKPITRVNILLSRSKVLYSYLTTWVPMEEWNEASMSSVPIKFWYRLETHSIQIEELDDAQLLLLLHGEKRTIPQDILHRLHDAMLRTVGDLQGQYIRAMETSQKIGSYLDRIGLLI